MFDPALRLRVDCLSVNPPRPAACAPDASTHLLILTCKTLKHVCGPVPSCRLPGRCLAPSLISSARDLTRSVDIADETNMVGLVDLSAASTATPARRREGHRCHRQPRASTASSQLSHSPQTCVSCPCVHGVAHPVHHHKVSVEFSRSDALRSGR